MQADCIKLCFQENFQVVDGSQCHVKNKITGEEFYCGTYGSQTRILINETDSNYKMSTEVFYNDFFMKTSIISMQ